MEIRRSSDETLEKRLELCPQKGFGASYTLGNTLLRDIALQSLFKASSIPPRVFTLDCLSLHEKRRLKTLAVNRAGR
jgi:hypothetical protein